MPSSLSLSLSFFPFVAHFWHFWDAFSIHLGSFCAAWTIRQVHLYTDDRAYRLPNQKNRQLLCERINAANQKKGSEKSKTLPLRCVVTRLRTDLFAQFDKYERGQEDIKADLKILARIGTGEHPNIIELHGIGTSSIDHENNEKENHEGITFRPSFLILSRIRYTGEDLLLRWKEKRGLRMMQALTIDQDNIRKLWLERMSLLADVADALSYIHSKRIIYLDLKPANVGTDYRGVVKLFDFGLAKLLDKEGHGLKKLYHLSGDCGTQRYMSPEVGKGKKYGHSADIYSLAIFMYQVLSLQTPYTNILSSRSFKKQVFQKHVRPTVESAWPERLRDLLQSMWQADPLQRPTAAEVATILDEMIKGPEEEFYPTALFSKERWFPTKDQETVTDDDPVGPSSGGLFSKIRLFPGTKDQEDPPRDEEEDLNPPPGGLFSRNRWFPTKEQQEGASEEGEGDDDDSSPPGLFSKNRWFPAKEPEKAQES